MSFYSFPPWQLWNFVFLYAFMWLHCWGSPSAGWKIISRHRILQKGVSLLRIKSRDKVGTVSTVGRPPDRPRRADSFYGLIANSYGLKTKKIPAGRQWHPTPVLLLRESHGWRSLVGCSPWGHWESDMTERLHFHFSLSCTGEGNGNPLQCSCLENPRDGGAWWAAVSGVVQSRARLKRLSSRETIGCFLEWTSLPN